MSALELGHDEHTRYLNEDALDPQPGTSWGKLLALVPERARVLDVGCSYGAFSAALRRLRSARVVGVEIDEAAAAVARSRCDELFVGDIRELVREGRIEQKFDVIVAADVLEHLVSPGEVLVALRGLLAPGGVLLASIPNVTHLAVLLELAAGRFPRTDEGLLDRTHLQFYGEADVRGLFHDAGYASAVVDRVRVDPRHSELKSDLSRVPPEALEFFERNPAWDTYQFIVRAVPAGVEELALVAPSEELAASDPPLTMRETLAGELIAAHEKLAEYHRGMQRIKAEADELHERARLHHHALTENGLQISRLISEAEERDAYSRRLEELVRSKDEDYRSLEREFVAVRELVLEKEASLRTIAGLVESKDRDYRALEQSFHARSEELRAASQRAEALSRECSELHLAKEDLLRQVARERESRLAEEARNGELRLTLARQSGVRRILPGEARASRLSAPLTADERARLRVLYITDRTDAPFRYRCAHGCEQLRASGVNANVMKLDDPELLEELGRYSVVVLFRLPASSRVREVVERARANGARVAFEIDDLIFDPAIEPQMTFLRDFPAVKLAEYRHQFGALRETLHLADFGIASTPVIAEAMRDVGKDAIVFPNLLSPTYVSLSRVVARLRPMLVRESCFLGYMSGSNTHDADLESIAPALVEVLRARPEASLVICGHSGLPPELNPFAERVLRIPYQDWRVYPWLMARCRVLLAPLQTLNDFSNAKSALKVFEAGAFGVPVVASPTDEYRRAIVDGVSGYLAREHSEWVRATTSLLDVDSSLRVGAAARTLALAEHSPRAHRHTLARALLARAGVSSSEAAAARPVDEEPPMGLPSTDALATGVVASMERSKVLGAATRLARGSWWLARASLSLAVRPRLLASESPGEARRVVSLDDATAARAVRFVAGLRRDGRALRAGDALVGCVLCDREQHLARDVARSPELAPLLVTATPMTSFSAQGRDPWIELPAVLGSAGSANVLLLELRATTPSGLAGAQLYWRGADDDSFAEARSITFRLIADGAWHEYGLDLSTLPGGFPDLSGGLRLDPLDEQGRVELGTIAIVECAAIPAHGPALAETLSARFAGAAMLSEPRSLTELARAVASEFAKPTKDSSAARTLIARVRDERDDAALARSLASIALSTGIEVNELARASDGDRWVVLCSRRDPATHHVAPPVDIIIPIYNAREMTNRCIESVLEHAHADFRLVLVDDASTDLGLRADLDEWATRDPRIVLLRNEKNLGFTGTANRGMRHADGRDILLLNSDTEVFAGFLERLSAAAYADASTGVLTPFSNNATICSIPEFPRDNDIPDGYTPASWAEVVSLVSRSARPEIVTGVGFCMYVKAEVVAKIGYLDEDAFGRGFGEENDLCERAKKAGYTVRLCDDVFVYHKGKASFGDEGRALEHANAKILEGKHPGYHAAVARFVETNPLASLHDAIRFHMPRLRDDARGAPLYVLQSSPFAPTAGGTEHHVLDLLRALVLPRAVIVYPRGAALEVAEILDGRTAEPTLYSFELPAPVPRYCATRPDVDDVIAHIVRVFGVTFAHIHHLMFWPADLGRALHENGVPYALTGHDYFLACPAWNLFDYDSMRPCDCTSRTDDERRACTASFLRQIKEESVTDVGALLTTHASAIGETLEHARLVIFPSEAARALVLKSSKLDPARAKVIGHGLAANDASPADVEALTGEDAQSPRAPGPLVDRPSSADDALLRVAVLGEVAYPLKGADNYLALIEACRDLPIEWHFFGNTNLFGYNEKLRALGLGDRVVQHGRYQRDQIIGLLREAKIELAVLLPIWAETFSYTLSEALLAGVPALVTTLGALGERVARDGTGIAVDSVESAARQLKTFAVSREALAPYTRAARAHQHATPAENAAATRDAYAAAGLFANARVPRLDAVFLRELEAHRLGVPAHAPHGHAAPPPEPPAYQGSLWYPAFLKVKQLVPPAVRQWGREQLVRRELRVRQTLRPARLGPDQLKLESLEWRSRRLGRSALLATTADPQLIFAIAPFRSAEVRALRFKLRAKVEGYAYAQFFWTHLPIEGFHEEKSAKVTLEPGDGWREYTLRVDTPGLAERWRAGEEVISLRFDPMNFAGELELAFLELRG